MNVRILLVVLVVLAVSCGDNGREQVLSRDTVSYLEAVIPPCADNEGSAQEPCATDIPDLEMVSIQATSSFWPREEGDPPTFTDLLLGVSLLSGIYYPSLAPHIVVRGIAKPNSTRCNIYPVFRPEREMLDDLYIGFFHYLCFVDITINEYLVGTGPATLTVTMHQENLWYVDMNNLDREKQKTERGLEYPQQRTASAFEGREVILFLGTTSTIAVEAWEPSGAFSIWYVQKHGDQLRVVSPALSITTIENKREWLDHPIEEFTQMVKRAAEERIELTSGRTGIEIHHPSLVTDANFLQDYYIAIGAVYDSSDKGTVLPPLAPGEGDPAAPTIPANEGTTDTTLPVPGEETSVPPSSDDAGLVIGQETTTTTSTTTVAEVPVTTEITPTVTTAAPVEEPVATVPDATETVTGTTTTTTTAVVETESDGEDVAPSADDDSSGGEPADSTSVSSTLVQTTAVVAPSGGDDGSVGGPDTTVPPDGVAPPVDNGGPEEAEQPDTGPPVEDG